MLIVRLILETAAEVEAALLELRCSRQYWWPRRLASASQSLRSVLIV
jgi:hypothetical protein